MVNFEGGSRWKVSSSRGWSSSSSSGGVTGTTQLEKSGRCGVRPTFRCSVSSDTTYVYSIMTLALQRREPKAQNRLQSSCVFFAVKKAKGLNVKGKNGTNDALVTIALGKEKYQTSVKEKAVNPVEWCEQCEL